MKRKPLPFRKLSKKALEDYANAYIFKMPTKEDVKYFQNALENICQEIIGRVRTGSIA